MSNIITQGLNWLITEQIEDLSSIKKMLSNVTEEDWSTYTSAKGPNSKQHYVLNPEWMPSKFHQIPEGWDNIKSWYETEVKKTLVHHGLLPSKWQNLSADRAWTVIGEEGSYHTIHDHGPNRVCSVTYIDVPEQQLPKQGDIYFVLQCDPYSQLSPVRHKVVHVTPKAGLMVIFPSWLLHGVYPQGPGIRQTLNIDFSGILNDSPEQSAGYTSLMSS